jgi:Rps23 Pro-64 3,4-dihydroxylase Tpa1-like proline 4-hydroxylase
LRSMISYTSDHGTLAKIGEASSALYTANKPWPHLVIDDFFDPEWLERVRLEASAIDRSKRYAKFLDRKTDHNKFAFLPDVVGSETTRLVNFLNSGPFLAFLEKLTGISGLLADPSYFGGGLHKILAGGFLEIHADFNHLKRYDLERRLNLLLYLNKEWQPSYQGDLEMWDRPSMTRVTAVAPVFNRCVIFSTTAESLHGHPVPLAAPPGTERMSIALYYYTNTWEAVAVEHSTLFYISQNNRVRLRADRILKTLVQDLTPPIFRKSIRALKRRRRGDKTVEV